MMRLVVFALLFTAVFAGGHGGYAGHHYAAPAAITSHVVTKHVAPIVQAPPVVHYAQRTEAVHHPGTVSVHEKPATIVQQGPAISGYSFNSQVQHNVRAAPVVHAAPVHHAAPLHHAAPIAHAAPLHHGAQLNYAAPLAHAAPIVSGLSAPIAVGAPHVQQHAPLVRSYSTGTDATHLTQSVHYNPVSIPITRKVVHAAPVVHAARIHAAPFHHAAPIAHAAPLHHGAQLNYAAPLHAAPLAHGAALGHGAAFGHGAPALGHGW